MGQELTFEYNKKSFQYRFENLPYRIFLDTNIVQYLNDFGAFIFENEREHKEYFMASLDKKIRKGEFLFAQIEALQKLFFAIERTPFEFSISYNVYEEVRNKKDSHLAQWFYDLWSYWQSVIEDYNGYAFSGQGKSSVKHIKTDKSIKGALSKKDFKIFCDAIELECQAVLTCDKFRNGQKWIYDKYGIMILYPTDLVELAKDFKALW